MTFEIPKIKVRADYESSGVLILVQASGSGEYWGVYGNLKFIIIKLSINTLKLLHIMEINWFRTAYSDACL